MTSVTLGYSLKLFPSRTKADTLAALAALFSRTHADVTNQLRAMEQPRQPSTKGMGEFIGRAYRRAYKDYERTTKAGHRPGHLKAELIDSAEIQHPRKATGFDCWIMLRGTTRTRGRKGGFYIPARRHAGINRALALPGAVLNESAEVYRRNGKWYARVSVDVPAASVHEPRGWLGVDVGLNAAVTRSDGHQGPRLWPIIARTKQRKADQQRNGVDRKTVTCQRHLLSHEARTAVTVCLRSRRGLVMEDPKKLPRYKQWAGRHFASRVQLLAAIAGVPVSVIPPPYTSITCSRCGWVERWQRHKETFRCWHCGFIHNADINAARVIRRRAHGYCHSHQGSLSPSPGGAEADE